MAAFVALCEGFLGISPHFDLWRYFFAVNLQKKREKGPLLISAHFELEYELFLYDYEFHISSPFQPRP